MSEKEAKELINKMLFYQKLYTDKTDVTVFQKDFTATTRVGGIAWGATAEGFHWWNGKVRTKHGNVRKILLKLIAICPPNGFDFAPKTEKITIGKQVYII